MTKRTKRDLLMISFAIALFAALNNISVLINFVRRIVFLCLPIILGLAFAFILNAPMRAYERLLDRIFIRLKRTLPVKAKNIISLFLAIISILLVFVLVFTIAIPKITESVKSIIEIIDSKIPDLLIFLEENGIDTTSITQKLAEFDLHVIIKNITQGAFTIVSTAVDATMIAVRFFTSAIFSIIIAIYLLLDKNNISRHAKKISYSIFSEKRADVIYKTSYLIRDTFAKFLSGQCLEAVILAFLILVLFFIFGLEYGGLIAVLAAVLSFIPYIGSFVACIIGVLLNLIVSPTKGLICLAVYLSAQMIEQHFIYPRVVGNSVGLSPFYTIIAVLLGGNLFGVFGMLFFIPLFSVISTIIKDYVNKKSVAIDEDKKRIEEKNEKAL